MGNNNVYGEGNFITPNKVIRNIKLDQKCINIENIFGRMEINTARADQANDTLPNHNVDVSEVR